ncbi:MAG TPA: FecR domain-containing protein [Rariglobus sp.]|jgi:hypothetical protein|nr:FecR domain-containing protein [Rariglobus sp.]
MKKPFYSLLIGLLFSLGSLCAHGAEATSQAIVLKVKGTVNYTMPGQTTPVALKVGDKLPQGATIVTGAKSEASIQAFNGAVAYIMPDTTANLEKLSVTTSGGVVTKQTALLNLKVGTILSTIDPANHNINDYGIRTPKGVAAARGTAYGVTVTTTGKVQLFVTNSAVTFTNSTTGKSITVPAGSAVAVHEDGTFETVPFSSLDQGFITVLEDAYGKFQEVGGEGSTSTTGTYDPNTTPQSPNH